jgi:hypothetical protein
MIASRRDPRVAENYGAIRARYLAPAETALLLARHGVPPLRGSRLPIRKCRGAAVVAQLATFGLSSRRSPYQLLSADIGSSFREPLGLLTVRARP